MWFLKCKYSCPQFRKTRNLPSQEKISLIRLLVMNTLIPRKFCGKMMRVNVYNFHTVCAMHKIEYKYITNLFFKNYVYTYEPSQIDLKPKCCVNCLRFQSLIWITFNLMFWLFSSEHLILKALLNFCICAFYKILIDRSSSSKRSD